MIKIQIRHETRLHEEHEVNVNGKVFTLKIEKGAEGPVFSFDDFNITLDPVEQEHLLQEMKEIEKDFSSRRLWGTYVPKTFFPKNHSTTHGTFPKKSFKKV
jgi:hypothetical protein